MAKEKKKEGGGIGELLAYAGDRKLLTYLGMGLSAVSQLLSFGPYVCIWFVARDLIAVAPNWSEAANIAAYGWWAVGFALASIVVYFAGLMCTHLAAFRCASNIRKATSEHLLKLPLGYFDAHATGELRRIEERHKAVQGREVRDLGRPAERAGVVLRHARIVDDSVVEGLERVDRLLENLDHGNAAHVLGTGLVHAHERAHVGLHELAALAPRCLACAQAPDGKQRALRRCELHV